LVQTTQVMTGYSKNSESALTPIFDHETSNSEPASTQKFEDSDIFYSFKIKKAYGPENQRICAMHMLINFEVFIDFSKCEKHNQLTLIFL